MMKKYILLVPVVLAVISCGCFFGGKPVKTACFNAEAADFQSSSALRTGAVSNVSGAGREFLVRGSGGRVRVDRSRQWLTDPGQMLRTALITACPGGEKGVISAQILRFEFAPEFKSLDGVILFEIRRDGKTVSILCRESVPVENDNYGKAAAVLFERCIKKALERSAL